MANQRVNGVFGYDYPDCTSYVISDVAHPLGTVHVYKCDGMDPLNVRLEKDPCSEKEIYRLVVWNSKEDPTPPCAEVGDVARKQALRTIAKFHTAAMQALADEAKTRSGGEEQPSQKRDKE